MRVAILLTCMLGGCNGTIPFEFVKAKNVEEVRLPANCGRDVLPNYGCYRSITLSSGCKIMVVWPRDTGDTANLRTLGEEVMKCVDGIKDY